MNKWVVLDWNCFRSVGLKRLVRPRGDLRYVLSDYAFKEAVDSDDPERWVSAITDFLRSPHVRGRVLVAKFWEAVSRSEVSPRRPATKLDAIDWDETRELDTMGVLGKDEVKRALVRFGEIEAAAHRKFVDAFVEVVFGQSRRFREHERPAIRRVEGDEVKRRDWVRRNIRHPELSRVIIDSLAITAVRRRSRKWRNSLSVFPDRFALAKMARVMAWYCVELSTMDSVSRGELRNDYEDAMYAHVASYTGCIATRDRRRLSRMIGDVFPNVRVVDPGDVIGSS